jgi:BlaI family transcriptional regulator, penicillinase repressor
MAMDSGESTPTNLGDTELEIMHVVWEIHPCTVAQVHALISAEREVAYTTIMTVMGNLARKGYLSHTKRGKKYIYRAERSAREVRTGLVRGLLQRAFDDSPLALALNLVREESLSPAELAELKEAIRRLETGEGRHD